MKGEYLKAWKESLTETTAMTKREFLLISAVCILSGIVFGMMISPRKNVMFGSKNGNNNGNGSCNNSGNGRELQIGRKKKTGDLNRREDE